jgi:RHS repeat-associated protein
VDGPNDVDDDHDGEMDEADETDRFVGLEGEELVLLADSTYRARIEGSFIRYRRVGTHWEAHLKNGTKLEFGLTATGRITDSTGVKVYEWLLEKSTNTNGNVIEYVYGDFSGSVNQKYLKEIRYGPGAPPWEAFYFAALTYEDRPDWRKDYRSGFMIKTTKRLSQIDVGIQGTNPAQCAVGDWNGDGTPDALIRRYVVSYSEDHPDWSYLSKITQYGSDGINYLPPLSFSYSTFDPAPTVSAEGLVMGSEGEPVSVMDSQLVELIDLNRDGLPDLLKTDLSGGSHTGYLNLGVQDTLSGRSIQWDTARDVASVDGLALQLHLDDTQVHLSDMDGDGVSDLVHTTLGGEVYYYLNQGDAGWGSRQGMSVQDTSPPAPFGNNQVKTTDLDFDKRMDVVKSSESGYAIWFNLGGGKYSREVRTAGAEYQGQALVFSDQGVRLADINGDRMSDVVKITPTQVIYCANMGHGHFDAAVSIPIPDETLTTGPTGQVAKAQFQDIDGDGLSDLVIERAGGNQLWYWPNLGTDTFSLKHIITDMPTSFGEHVVTRWADINGNGTTDLIYADSTAVPRLRTLDIGELVGGSAHPNILTEIDNGLGVVTRISYRSSVEYAQQACQEGSPWATGVPFPVSVVSAVEVATGMDLDEVPGEDRYLKSYIYRDGYYDDLEKAFRGFSQTTVIDHGDVSAPTQVTEHRFFTGGPDGVDNDGDGQVDEVSPEGYREEEALKGRTREREVKSEDDDLFSRESRDWRVRTLLTNSEGTEIRFAYSQEATTLVYEGTDSPEILRSTYAYDAYGNVIEQRDYGALSIAGDEIFTYTSYILDTDHWILDKPSRVYVTDAEGHKAKETRWYYDGEAYVGLELGGLEKGNVTREEGWVEDERYTNVIRNAFDAFGNVTSLKDGNGNVRSMLYDTTFHSRSVKETIHLGNEADNLIVSADYNLGLGTITASTDFNGHRTYYQYDTFGRLVKIVGPESSFEYPTKRFTYTMSDPSKGLVYSYEEEGNLALSTGSSKPSSILTKKREHFGRPDTIDSIQYTDGMGRKLAVIEKAEGGFVVKEAYRFNARGLKRYAFLPYSAETFDYYVPSLSGYKNEIQFDAAGRGIRQTNPPDEQGVLTYRHTQYSPLRKELTDENGNSVIYVNDGQSRLIRVHEENDGENIVTRYEYDALGNLIKITDAQNNITIMTYDGLSRKTQTNCPNRGRTVLEYDNVGNLIRTMDNKGQTIVYTYDAANRVVTEDYLDDKGIALDVAYYYDSASAEYPAAANLKGALAWVKDLSGKQYFSYDSRNNLIWTVKRINQLSSVTDYETVMNYDAMNRMTFLAFPDGDSVEYRYNKRSFVDSIPGIVQNIDHSPSGKIDTITYANGVKTEYSYDPRQRLTHIETQKMTEKGTILQDLHYALDGKGSMTAITDGRNEISSSAENASQAFQYDDLYRLIRATGPGYGVIDYQYDKIGNMIWKKSPDAPDPAHVDNPSINLGSMSYGGLGGSSNRSNRLPGDPPGPHAVTSTGGGLRYHYDDNGNMIGNGDGDVYRWDFMDRLTRVQRDGTDSRYTYDYGGRRVIKRATDSQGEKLAIYVSKYYEIRDGKAIKYVFAGNRRIARIEGKVAGSAKQTKQVLAFQPGWNFFSLAVEPEDSAVANVLEPIEGKFTGVWAYDSLGKGYKGYVPSRGVDELGALSPQMGHVINVTDHAALEVSGTKKTDALNMEPGWNLIGCPADVSLPVEEALASIGEKFVFVWSYETMSMKWKLYDPARPVFLNDLEEMKPGKAYWVKMNTQGQVAYLATSQRKVYFYHPDHLGSSSLITDNNGAVSERTEFYPFGLIRFEQRSGFEAKYRFTGKERDPESGLDYFGARYYLPLVGRFISVDPAEADLEGPQAMNKYTYCRNNPLILIDPQGLNDTHYDRAVREFEQIREGSLNWWGIDRRFPQLYHQLQDQARQLARQWSFDDFNRARGNPSTISLPGHARGVGRIARGNIEAEVNDQMYEFGRRILVGSRAATVIGAITNMLQGLDRVAEESSWNQPEIGERHAYRERMIYALLLRRTAQRMHNTTSWNSRVNRIYHSLIFQTQRYRYWMDNIEPGLFQQRRQAIRRARVEDLVQEQRIPRRQAEEIVRRRIYEADSVWSRY